MLARTTLTFLRSLGDHNNRAWFKQNRKDYEAARSDCVAMVDELIGRIAAFDPPIVENDPSDAIFRINRDTRFSKDKTPYKTNFGAFLTDSGTRKISRAGYYIHVEPGGSLLAGGLYMPPAPELRAVRAAIERHAVDLRKIMRDRAFTRYFGTRLPGLRVKTAPRGIPRDHPDLDLLQLKSLEVVHPLKDSQLLRPDFTTCAANVFRAMKPFVKWINKALDDARED